MEMAKMRDNQAANTIYLSDYTPPAFLVDTVELDFDLYPQATLVTATLVLRRNPERLDKPSECILNGEELSLRAIAIDGVALAETDYRYKDECLTIEHVPDAFTLRTTVSISPQDNSALDGLYMSNGMYCTQCEAEGFRRITFFPDRPDVLSKFTTTVRADKSEYPLLLSNGNPVASGDDGERHWARWEDPFAKPCYLFALVAGNLACLEDSFTTVSGRDVILRIFAESRDLDKLDHAMDSLKRSMRWDEEVYGREYDLDIYMIVAVSHFNMGAMENKGLNIFNTACVLAHPQTTTDAGFQRVEAVVAHEYFHNWSGNRVTCRDWFQLSLKEGFTVFRDQSFSADMHSFSVKRVEDVDLLRTVQFAEDGGPMAHAIRPDAYQKIDNFYTVTIYEKGAEVVRMQYNLLGAEQFRAATDLYFSRFDGQAVTCDDFVDCMEEVSGIDLSRFRRWYSQAGTPTLTVEDEWSDGVYTLRIQQHTPPTPGQPDKQPLLIPLSLSLLDESGCKLALNDAGDEQRVLFVDQADQTYHFSLASRPVPSLLRGFSAPVHLAYDYTNAQLACLLAHDDDGFVRWNSAQQLFHAAVSRIIAGEDAETLAVELSLPMLAVLDQAETDPAGAALILSLPSEAAISERYTPFYPHAIHRARSALEKQLGLVMANQWAAITETFSDVSYRADALSIGRRALSVRAMAYRAAANEKAFGEALLQKFRSADNMTMRLTSLRLLVWHSYEQAAAALEQFEVEWRDEPLVMDQWFAVQAARPGVNEQEMTALMEHELFDWRLPNRVRAVLSTFASANLTSFHNQKGFGYQLFSESLSRLDKINPQIAARLAGAYASLPRLEACQQELMRAAIAPLQGGNCSANLQEVVSRIIADA
jgi:aminopeptidase N